MNKLSLLLLLFAILVFQGCNKSYSVNGGSESEDLVPMMFSGAELTKAAVPTGPIKALVLGSTVPDSWLMAQIHSSISDNGLVKAIAKGNIDFNFTGDTGTGNFSPVVYYPFSNAFIYVKALAADGATMNDARIETENIAEFTITGKEDVMATGKINTTLDSEHGVGNRIKPQINLVFDHLLSKVEFLLIADDAKAQTDWGNITSIVFNQGNSTFEYNLSTNKTEITTATLKDFTVYDGGTAGAGKEIPVGTAETISSVMVYPTSGEEWTVTIKTVNQNAAVIASAMTLVMGKVNKITLSFSEAKVITITNFQVRPWVDGITGDDMTIE